MRPARWGDDIGVYNISAYSLAGMGYRTPNIDRIAKDEREGRASRRSSIEEDHHE